MIVEIVDYGKSDEEYFIDYSVRGLSQNQINYLSDNLDEKIRIDDGDLIITMYFNQDLYPFQSSIAQIRLDDFKAREEIEMNVFLSSFLEDM